MACCENHDRMDRLLTVEEYNDAPCGTPTNPSGEQRYCCRRCPSKGQALELPARWASNPALMAHLTDDERAAVFAKAVAAGPTAVDIVMVAPDPAPAGAPVDPA
jgi:hypothetical protein